MNLVYDGIHREESTVEYRCRRRRAFEGLTFDEDPDVIANRMKEESLADWEIGMMSAMVKDSAFRRTLSESDLRKRSVAVSSIARRNGIDVGDAHGMYVDAMIGSGLMDEDVCFDCYVDLSDVDDDVRKILRLAEAGDADAQYEMGMRYRRGDGTFEDEHESVKWLEAAAEQGHPAAAYEMGVSFDLGIGLPVDEYMAEKWYRKASEFGYKEPE